VDTTRPAYSQAVLGTARSVPEPARLPCEHARSARTSVDRPASLDIAGHAASTVARVGLAAHGVGYVLVEVAGAVDMLSRSELADVLTQAVDSGQPAVIVDLSAVTLLAAAGFGCLRGAADLLAGRDGHLHVVCPAGGPAARVLRILDPDGGWPVYPDVPAAVAAVEGRA
jgi:anti-anti-sigma factor